ncbi:DUF5004 domain-containing protein [Pedobacter arcticus]|uniref:DUF5004 domain-containing protein n=1 Tax=Pedobacter arcticus TaxID=752140 RepID=UPI00036222DA|nr:DUF5004 domain-containing protein [Pedobacter arcticus]
MKNKKTLTFLCLSFCAIAIFFSACKKEKTGQTTEATKDISGTWQISQLTRNGEDLTQRMDLSKFRIVFNEDKTYTLVDKLAFAVEEGGVYSLDDPQYPFSIILTPQSEPDASKVVKFQFPVVEGKRRMSLTMSMGCSSNTYNYVFEKLQ